MNIKNIIFSGLALAAWTSCNDFLEIDAPSKYSDEFVFSQESEISRALNGVYGYALVNDLYGSNYQSKFILNSDVDISISSSNAHAHDTYSRFDCDAQGSDIEKFWTAAYALIELSNRFVYGVEHSELYTPKNASLMQYLGEAKCLRAMAYHDLVVMFGDVPFTFLPAQVRIEEGDGYLFPILDRQAVQDSLIADLQSIAPYMANTRVVSVERCSKEFAQGLIARIALTAGGYSL
ncbi:MAG: RagB/SusD family nutrient uptake outer membrane protein, partial [Bacteroidales bacterium]|nr:RagB/SusD family nutrient uptake outer membrane protein [Bacteroidales bacterium]